MFFRTSYGDQFDERRWELEQGRLRPNSAPGWRIDSPDSSEYNRLEETPSPPLTNAIHPTADAIMHNDTLTSKQELTPKYHERKEHETDVVGKPFFPYKHPIAGGRDGNVCPGAQYWPMPAKGPYNKDHLVTTSERNYNEAAIDSINGLDGAVTRRGHGTTTGYGRNNDHVDGPSSATPVRSLGSEAFRTTYRELQCTGFNTTRPSSSMGFTSTNRSGGSPFPQRTTPTAWDDFKPRATGANCLSNARQPPLRPNSALHSACKQWVQ
jgi:hypothetical protein